MVFRPESIRARLLRLEEVISGLEHLRREGNPQEGVVAHRWATERGLHLGAEILLDIGSHLLSAEFGVAPESYDDIIRQLGRHQVLSEDLLERLRGMAGFRNLLVHDYLRLDPDRVRAILADAPEVYSAFAEAIRDWMDQGEVFHEEPGTS